jgi:hypothetical protein
MRHEPEKTADTYNRVADDTVRQNKFAEFSDGLAGIIIDLAAQHVPRNAAPMSHPARNMASGALAPGLRNVRRCQGTASLSHSPADILSASSSRSVRRRSRASIERITESAAPPCMTAKGAAASRD